MSIQKGGRSIGQNEPWEKGRIQSQRREMNKIGTIGDRFVRGRGEKCAYTDVQ